MAAQTSNTVYAEASETESSSTHEYLSFVSDGLNYIINAAFVQEIIMNQSITHLPKVPDYIRGITNLRGQVIPIMDIRLKMNRMWMEYDGQACIIVINIKDIFIGLLVEKVSHVVNLNEDIILPPPGNKGQELVSGIADIDGQVYLVMDCEKLVQR